MCNPTGCIMAVFAYCRVSTERQAEEGVSLDEQQRRIDGQALMEGWTLQRGAQTQQQGNALAAVHPERRECVTGNVRTGQQLASGAIDSVIEQCVADALLRFSRSVMRRLKCPSDVSSFSIRTKIRSSD